MAEVKNMPYFFVS